MGLSFFGRLGSSLDHRRGGRTRQRDSTAYPRAAAVLPAGESVPFTGVKTESDRARRLGLRCFSLQSTSHQQAQAAKAASQITASFLAECRGWDQASQLQSTVFRFHRDSGV